MEANSSFHKSLNINGIHNIDYGRPPKNIDILRFVLSRTAINRGACTISSVTWLVVKEIKKCWLSLVHGIEQEFLADESVFKRIEKIITNYQKSVKSVRTPTTDILEFHRQKQFEMYSFLNDVFCPLVNFGPNKENKHIHGSGKRRMTQGEWVHYRLDVAIRPAIVSIPSFDDFMESAQLSPPVNIENDENSYELLTPSNYDVGKVYMLGSRNAVAVSDRSAQTDLQL